MMKRGAHPVERLWLLWTLQLYNLYWERNIWPTDGVIEDDWPDNWKTILIYKQLLWYYGLLEPDNNKPSWRGTKKIRRANIIFEKLLADI